MDTEKLPESVKYNVGYMVAQLHAALGEYDQALSFAEEWFVTLEAPSPKTVYFYGKCLRADRPFLSGYSLCRDRYPREFGTSRELVPAGGCITFQVRKLC
ncbi:MAG: hypothetical protein CM15mP120_04230 [Pseudomonadota bacterium]|nr:MAG: hypothetical protein CM15mP120_04230 [Pseudomonadota bacterium]